MNTPKGSVIGWKLSTTLPFGNTSKHSKMGGGSGCDLETTEKIIPVNNKQYFFSRFNLKWGAKVSCFLPNFFGLHLLHDKMIKMVA